jgi:hypothetical protein
MIVSGSKRATLHNVAKKAGVAGESAPDEPPAEPQDLPAAELLALLQGQLARQEAGLSDLRQQLLSSTALVQSLAEQNAQLVQRVEANRVRVRWLTLAVFVLGLGLAALWALARQPLEITTSRPTPPRLQPQSMA